MKLSVSYKKGDSEDQKAEGGRESCWSSSVPAHPIVPVIQSRFVVVRINLMVLLRLANP